MNGKTILHYTVGLNKNRGGGLTKYVDDLVDFQSNDNKLIILYPGEYSLLSNLPSIVKERKHNNAFVYSILNPLSLPMMFGLRDYDYIYKKSDINIWKKFLTDNNVDIIHLHTLMGLYQEFLLAAKELKIPTIYTTHDYFGLCPKQTFIFNDNVCNDWEKCSNCPACNLTALSRYKIILIHSKLFSLLRKFSFFKKMKMKAKKRIDTVSNKPLDKKFDVHYYLHLKEKMVNSFELIDYFHYNSSISRMVFNKILPNLSGDVINISHANICDNRIIRNYGSKKLRVTYLGSTTSAKGFFKLIEEMDKLYLECKNIELNIYSYTDVAREYINKNNVGYSYGDLEHIFENTDVLIAPSKMYESFGFTVAEALSYGVPVIVSSSIGAKDLIINGKNGFVVDNDKISEVLKKIAFDRKILNKMNNYIVKSNFYSFELHCKDIYNLYSMVIHLKNKKEN